MKIRGKQKFKPRDVTDANDAKFHSNEVCVFKMHPCEVVYHVHAFVPVQAPNDVGTSKFNWDWCLYWILKGKQKCESMILYIYSYILTVYQYILIRDDTI